MNLLTRRASAFVHTHRGRAPDQMRSLLLFTLAAGARSQSCAHDLVYITLHVSKVVHNNFAGEAAGDANIRIQGATSHNGKDVDVVLSSPSSAGSSGPCWGVGTCDFSVNGNGIGDFKVRARDPPYITRFVKYTLNTAPPTRRCMASLTGSKGRC